jgi:hypothetical protein
MIDGACRYRTAFLGIWPNEKTNYSIRRCVRKIDVPAATFFIEVNVRRCPSPTEQVARRGSIGHVSK